MSKVKMTATVVSQEALTDDIFSMWIQADEIASQAVPGQFISVYTKDSGKLLPRPISLCQVDREQGRLRIVYRVVGAGTKEFAGYQAGDDVEILGPDSSAQTGGSSSGTSSGGVTPPVETAAPDLSGQSAPGVGVSGFGTEGDGQLIAPGAGAALPGGSGPASGSGSAGGQGAGGGSSSQTGGQAASSSVRGDTNGDGRLNILDVLNAQRHILGLGTLDGAGAAAADVNGNGKVDIMDVLLMQKDILGIEKLN